MLFGGGFRQTFPIIKCGSTDSILDACVIASALWKMCFPFDLITNMRARKNEQEFAAFLAKFGSNLLPTRQIPPFHSCIEIPNSCICAGEFDTTIFPDGLSSTEFQQRVILTPTNRSSLAINDNIQRMPGELHECFSVYSVVVDGDIEDDTYSIGILNSLTPSGVPLHILLLKRGAVLILLKNLDLKAGLTNGSRLIIKDFFRHLLDVEILSGYHRRQRHYLQKMLFQPSDSGFPFVLKQLQFPI